MLSPRPVPCRVRWWMPCGLWRPLSSLRPALALSFHLPFTPVPVTGQTFAVLADRNHAGGASRLSDTGSLPARRRVGIAGLRGWDGAGAAILIGRWGRAISWAFPVAASFVGWLAGKGWDAARSRPPARWRWAVAYPDDWRALAVSLCGRPGASPRSRLASFRSCRAMGLNWLSLPDYCPPRGPSSAAPTLNRPSGRTT